MVKPQRDLNVDDIVLIKDDSLALNHWQLGRVTRTYPDEDGRVRKVQLTLADPSIDAKGVRVQPPRSLERPIHKLVFLMSWREAVRETGRIPHREALNFNLDKLG